MYAARVDDAGEETSCADYADVDGIMQQDVRHGRGTHRSGCWLQRYDTTGDVRKDSLSKQNANEIESAA